MSGLPVGIDLGTTHSLIAVLDETGQVKLIAGTDGSVLTPSAVGLSDSGTLVVGAAAQARRVTHPDKTHVLFKRHMGTGKQFRLGRQNYSASDMAAFVLRKLKQDFDAAYPGRSLSSLVISVPAYFSSAQREATVLAAALAGLPEPRLVNEPTAAALAYGLQDREGESTFLVLDLGGGTFDVSIIEMFEGVMEVRASSGDTFLGGEDFTEVIARDVAKHCEIDWDRVAADDRTVITAVAEAVKRRLSDSETAEVTLPLKGGQRYQLQRDQFEALAANLLLRLRRPIDICLYDAKTAVDALNRVLLVGGATRMPMIRALATRALRRFPETTIDPDHVVAMGAAVQAALAERNVALSDLVMTDVAPFSLGINSMLRTPNGVLNDAFAPIIERSTVLPTSRVQRFFTTENQQSRIEFGVYQGESPIAKENVKVGAGKISIPPAPAGEEAIDVRFSYDPSGLLHVGVTVISTGEKTEIIIEGSAKKMSPSERKQRVKALETLMFHPRDDSVNLATMERLKGLYAMLLGDDRDQVTSLIAAFEKALASQDPGRIAEVRVAVDAAAAQIEMNYVR